MSHFITKKRYFNKAHITTKKPGIWLTGEARDDVSPPIPSLRFLDNRQKVAHWALSFLADKKKKVVRQINRSWNRNESPEIHPYIYGQRFLTGVCLGQSNGKKSLQQIVLEQLNIHMQRNEVEALPQNIYKI